MLWPYDMVTMALESLCPTPHKKYFVSKGAAKLHLKQDARYYSKHAPKLYVYHCVCSGFHLTKSQRGPVKTQPGPNLVLQDVFRRLVGK